MTDICSYPFFRQPQWISMQPVQSYGSVLRPDGACLANSGDILFSTVPECSFFHSSSTFNSHGRFMGIRSSSAQSLADLTSELPTISANEVDEVLNQLISPTPLSKGSSQTLHSSSPLTGGSQVRKNYGSAGYGFSKDDSFTPPPIKRSFAIIDSRSPVGQRSLPLPFIRRQVSVSEKGSCKTSSLITALQLPHAASSIQSPNLHAALRYDRPSLQPQQKLQTNPHLFMSPPPPLQPQSNHELPKTFITLVNSANKQRQENFTVRMANRAKLITSTVRSSTGGNQQTSDRVGHLIRAVS